MTREIEKLMPEARREGLVYDLKRNKAHCLNSTAALVWEYCDGKTSVTGIARAIEGRTNGPVEEDLVWLGVEQLSKSDLLRERATPPKEASGLSRREVMKRIGLAAVVALPAVTSIIAPSAAQAANCLPSTSPCTSSAECCSGLCSGTPSTCA
jgi:hypothetical protein